MADISLDLTWSITEDGIIVELVADDESPALGSLELSEEAIIEECAQDMENVFDTTADPGEWIDLAHRFRRMASVIERTVRESVQ